MAISPVRLRAKGLDLILIETWTHHLGLWWEFPETARQLGRLAAIGRLIRFEHELKAVPGRWRLFALA